MKTSRVIEVLEIIRENASCDECLYGYESIEDCEFLDKCPVDTALKIAIKIVSGLFTIRRGLAMNAAKFKAITGGTDANTQN